MSDLVKRLREYYSGKARDAFHIIDEAADRIEQLERELATEKALADEIHKLWEEAACSPKYWSKEEVDADAAYRKARGL